MPKRISCRLSESLPQCRDRCRHVHIVTRMGMYRSMPFLVNNRTCTFSLLRTWRVSGCKEHPCPWLLWWCCLLSNDRMPLRCPSWLSMMTMSRSAGEHAGPGAAFPYFAAPSGSNRHQLRLSSTVVRYARSTLLIHQIRQRCVLLLTVDDPFLQLFF